MDRRLFSSLTNWIGKSKLLRMIRPSQMSDKSLRLRVELKMEAVEAYTHITRLIEAVNSCVSQVSCCSVSYLFVVPVVNVPYMKRRKHTSQSQSVRARKPIISTQSSLNIRT